MRHLLAFALLVAAPATLAAQRMGFAPHFHGRSSGFHGEHFRYFAPRAGYPLGLFDLHRLSGCRIPRRFAASSDRRATTPGRVGTRASSRPDSVPYDRTPG